MRLAASFTGFVPRETATMEKLDDVQYYLEVGGARRVHCSTPQVALTGLLPLWVPACLQETAAIRLQNGLMKRYNKRWGRGYLFRLRLVSRHQRTPPTSISSRN